MLFLVNEKNAPCDPLGTHKFPWAVPWGFTFLWGFKNAESRIQKGHNPVSKKSIDFSKTTVAEHQTALLVSIKKTPNFALRLGRTVWRNNQWVLSQEKFKSLINKTIKIDDLTPSDVKPRIEQKAVDMKIGIDIAMIATKRFADVLIIITGDSDIVPALKLARQEGMQVGLDPLRHPIDAELSEHVDFIGSYV